MSFPDPLPVPGSRNGRRLLVLGTLAAAAAGAAVYRRARADRSPQDPEAHAAHVAALGWGSLEQPATIAVTTPDGARLAVWDIGEGPTVALPHCWGCTHAIWIPVARRLVEMGHRVVLYDQRGHGASTRGTAPLSVETLAHDFELVLESLDVRDAVMAGHSMGGMTIMSLATHRPDVLAERARALVLVATAAAPVTQGPAGLTRAAGALIGSPVVSRAMRSSGGRRYVRNVFGAGPIDAHLDLTRTLFGDCDPQVRAGFIMGIAQMNLLEGIATIDKPTTVVVGSRDRLTPPRLARQMVATIPGSRLVTLEDRGHMLPLEDPDAVADEIVRAVKG
jgi:non-heme chloroperoxidase